LFAQRYFNLLNEPLLTHLHSQAKDKNWQHQLLICAKISSGKARKENYLQAHRTRTSFIHSMGHYLITVGSSERPDPKENQWDVAGKALGVVNDSAMSIEFDINISRFPLSLLL